MFTFIIILLNLFLFSILFVLISKQSILARKFEQLKGIHNKISEQNVEVLKVLRDLAHEAGFCIQEKMSILNEGSVIMGAKPRIGKLLRLVESESSQKERAFFEETILPKMDQVIAGIESGKIKPITLGVDIKKKKV